MFTIGFCKDAPSVLAAAGAKGTVAVWDTLARKAVARKYAKELGHLRRAVRDGGGAEEGEEGEDEEEGEEEEEDDDDDENEDM